MISLIGSFILPISFSRIKYKEINIMPGYVIHVAVAQEYLKKHKNVKEDYDEFINGTIYPDSVSDKSLTHYRT